MWAGWVAAHRRRNDSLVWTEMSLFLSRGMNGRAAIYHALHFIESQKSCAPRSCACLVMREQDVKVLTCALRKNVKCRDWNVAFLLQEASSRTAIQHVLDVLELQITCAFCVWGCVITTGPNGGKVCNCAFKQKPRVWFGMLHNLTAGEPECRDTAHV